MNLFNELKDVFELAVKTSRFMTELFELFDSEKDEPKDSEKLASSENSAQLASSENSAQLASSGNYAKLASSGDYAKLASSENYAKLASSGNSAKLASSGDYAKLASSGNYAKLASSGDYAKLASSRYSAQLASSGNSAQLASSGNSAQLASSGYSAKLASSGYYAKLASSGYYAKLASSGDYAKLASSGDYAKLASSGDYAVLANIGFFGISKAKKGSWITLAYFSRIDGKFVPTFVKTEKVDGEKIKEDTDYCLYKTEFREVVIVDGISTVILNRKGTICKVWILGQDKESFMVEENGIFSHGETLKEARESLIYKIGNRDTSMYEEYTIETSITKEDAIKMYRVITGACEYGVKNFVSNQTTKKKRFTVQEIIDLTKGQYGNEKFKEFFVKSSR